MPCHQRIHRLSPPGYMEISEIPSCSCGKPDSHQSLIGCDGLCSRWFHYDCDGVNNTPSGEWICLCCTIKNARSVRAFRQIPKGARIQTAQALSTIINDSISGGTALLPWWKLILFWLYCIGHS